MTLYPVPLDRRFAAGIAAMRRDLNQLQTKTAGIDSGVAIPADPWHGVAAGPGFAAAEWADTGAGFPLAGYQFIAGARVAIRARALWTSTASVGLVSGQALWTIPDDTYWPATEQTVLAACFGSDQALAAGHVPAIEISVAGVVSIFEVTVPATLGQTVTIAFNYSYPLD